MQEKQPRRMLGKSHSLSRVKWPISWSISFGYKLKWTINWSLYPQGLNSSYLSNQICRYGIESLFRFYSYGLEKKFRLEVFKHFQQDTLEDYKNGQLYGLEKFWAFLRYSGRTDQGMNSELKAILAKYKSIDDFRVLQTKEK